MVEAEPGAKYTAHVGRASAGASSHVLGTRALRRVFFTLASLWGYAAGGLAALAASRIGNEGDGWGAIDLAVALAAAAVAVGGGFVSAGAYGEAKNRRRRG